MLPAVARYRPAVGSAVDWWDAVLAPVLFGWAVAADLSEPFSVGLVLLTGPVLVRRRWPTAAAALTAAGIALSSLWPIAPEATLPAIVAGLAVAYSVAVHARWPWAGLLLLRGRAGAAGQRSVPPAVARLRAAVRAHRQRVVGRGGRAAAGPGGPGVGRTGPVGRARADGQPGHRPGAGAGPHRPRTARRGDPPGEPHGDPGRRRPDACWPPRRRLRSTSWCAGDRRAGGPGRTAWGARPARHLSRRGRVAGAGARPGRPARPRRPDPGGRAAGPACRSPGDRCPYRRGWT